MELDIMRLKSLLGIAIDDIAQDVQLEFILEDVTETILNYCNLIQLPSGLKNTAYRMAVDLYRNEAVGQTDAPLGGIASIKEGDTSTSFNRSMDDNFKSTLLKNYTVQLNRYRKLVW